MPRSLFFVTSPLVVIQKFLYILIEAFRVKENINLQVVKFYKRGTGDGGGVTVSRGSV